MKRSCGVPRLSPFALLFVAALGSPYRLAGQEDGSFAEFHFNRSLPGARSLAMAGAFVAIADDATAAYANPAGLTLLSRREVAFEGRYWKNSFEFTDGGRSDGVPTGVGIDTHLGLVQSTGTSTNRALSFLSYVDAVQHRRWVVAAFYRTYARYHTRFDSQGFFSGPGNPRRFGPYRFRSDFDVDGFGISGASQFGDCVEFKGCLRAGVTLTSYSLQMVGSQLVVIDPPNNGPATFNEPRQGFAERVGDDKATAFSAGAIWEPSHNLALGVAFRQGPTFDIVQRVFQVPTEARISLPHEYSIGARWRLDSELLIGAEVTRVEYSRLLRDNSLAPLILEDGIEVRLGINKTLFQNDLGDRWNVMAGVWYDPDHSLAAKPTDNVVRRSYFRGGSSQWHISAGLGWRYRWLTANLGIDASRETRTGSLSMVLRR